MGASYVLVVETLLSACLCVLGVKKLVLLSFPVASTYFVVQVKIFNEKPKFDQVQAKVGSKDNLSHTPKGGNVSYSVLSVTQSSSPCKLT